MVRCTLMQHVVSQGKRPMIMGCDRHCLPFFHRTHLVIVCTGHVIVTVIVFFSRSDIQVCLLYSHSDI